MNNEISKDTQSAFIISVDRNPSLIVLKIEQLNERNFTKALKLKGWDMIQEDESVVKADKAFINSFLGNNCLFSKYAVLRRDTDLNAINIVIQKVPLMAIDILDMEYQASTIQLDLF